MVAPIQPLTNKEAVIGQIRKLSTGGGGIYIGATVQKADQLMRAENSKVRHFILLADGNDSEDPQDAIARTLAMRSDKITTTVVSIGDGKDVALLKNIAAVGGGRFFLAKRANQLPAIFTQDTAMVARSAIEEGEFYPEILAGDEMTRGINSTPTLLAYDLAELRPLARLAMRTHKKDPLLASWQYGLGTSVAFTSDAHARWAAHWAQWGGFPAFWAQVVRNLSRRNAENAFQVNLDTGEGRPTLKVQAQDKFGNARTDWNGKIRIGAPDGSSFEVQLAQTAPGVYEAPFDKSLQGSYMATVAEDGPAGKAVSVTGFSIAYPPEFRSMHASTALLQQAAEVSGGKEIQTAADAMRPLSRPGENRTDLWRTFLFMAMALLLVDVGVRRVAIPLAEMWARLRGIQVGWQESRTETRQAETLRRSRLKSAKERVTAHSKSPAPVSAFEREPASPEAPAAPKDPTPAPTIRPSTPSVSASTKLLEKKKARQEGRDE
jgi:Ca-activated chloride channel family protein